MKYTAEIHLLRSNDTLGAFKMESARKKGWMQAAKQATWYYLSDIAQVIT